jgi:hypothetical protein
VSQLLLRPLLGLGDYQPRREVCPQDILIGSPDLLTPALENGEFVPDIVRRADAAYLRRWAEIAGIGVARNLPERHPLPGTGDH